ncbi:MAG: PTS sugar transporter subunit IIA, partial [Spirochaetaceae bacterium]|nr:PTS sugar transporter subunit IIA [Spirochaetaceae bacterium]
MELLSVDGIVLNLPVEDREAVIRRCGRMLVDLGYAKERYIEGMLARDRSFSCAI